MSVNLKKNLNFYLSICSTTRYGDDIKVKTLYNKHQEIRITLLSEG